MKIAEIETHVVRLPTRRPHVISHGYHSIESHVIVKVRTDTEVVGFGEAAVDHRWGGDYMKYFGETPGTTSHIVHDFLAPAIRGESVFNLETILEKMDGTIPGYPYAKAAIDMALYDIIGKHLNVPAYNFLGGCFRERIPLAHSIGLMPLEKRVEEAVEVVKEGIKTIKLKVGINPEQDVEHVKAVREAVGDKIDITADANNGYVNPKTAIGTIRKMEKYNLRLMEQPVVGIEAMARVAEAVDTPIMADESAWTPHDILEIIQKKAADIISLYTTKPGGLYRCKKVVAVAEAAGMPCNVNGSIETGVGNAANLHLAASTKAVTEACVIPVTNIEGQEQTKIAGKYYLDDIIKKPFKYENGYLIVPNKPGMGIELDEEKLAKYKP